MSLIVPRLTYCSQVWSPRLKKDVILLDKVRRKFERRVASRCGISRDSFVLDSLRELHEKNDESTFRSLFRNGSVDHYFRLTPRVRGDGLNINAHHIARSEAVLGTFAWRYSRRTHGDYR